MSEYLSLHKLQGLLAEFGIRLYDYDAPWESVGFPIVVTLAGGRKAVFDLPEPGVLSTLDPKHVGVAICSHTGKVRQRWGVSNTLELFKPSANLLDTELAPLIQNASLSGDSGSIYLNGFRHFVSKAIKGTRLADIMILTVEAKEERENREGLTLATRSAEVFRRIGKAVSMHQNLNDLAIMAVHEISSAAGLASALLWAKSSDDDRITLRAHVGVNRQGAAVVSTLEPKDQLSCIAELAANKSQMLWVHNVHENPMTSQLEAKFCYLHPGGLCVMPLISGDRLIGVLELIGREADPNFAQSREMFETLGEHISLALNTCLLFESIERLASFDPMTGLANHKAMQDFLAARLSESERNGTEVGVVMIDVDHFRAFNEEEGHDAGDAVLKMVAAAIKDAVRPYDMPARYGGEEFSVIMPGLDLDFTFEVAERIRRKIEQIEYYSPNGHPRTVTASIGCSSFPDTAADASNLFKAADAALFKAKRGGRNRVIRYDGAYRAELAESEYDPTWMNKWMIDDEKAQSEKLITLLSPFLQYIGQGLMLSKAQIHILDQMVRIYPSYLRMMQDSTPDTMRKIELAAEFRPLLPSLMTARERFDGGGQMKMVGAKIPLLARVMSVLVAIGIEKGVSLVNDSPRFDPAILALIADVQEAA